MASQGAAAFEEYQHTRHYIVISNKMVGGVLV
jgi:hypothetical protein